MSQFSVGAALLDLARPGQAFMNSRKSGTDGGLAALIVLAYPRRVFVGKPLHAIPMAPGSGCGARHGRRSRGHEACRAPPIRAG
jgi:hypothetical protein